MISGKSSTQRSFLRGWSGRQRLSGQSEQKVVLMLGGKVNTSQS